MRVSKSWFCFALVALMASATPVRSFADTYQILTLQSDQGYFFYGMDASGDVVIDFFNSASACGIGPTTCYRTFVDGTATGLTGTPPSLVFDNGSPCTPVVPAGGSVVFGACNNGRDAFTGYLTASQQRTGVYTGTTANPVANTIPPTIENGGSLIFMNSQGDVVYDDIYADQWYEAIDLTPIDRASIDPTPQVPEPGSLLLLSTGALAALATTRRHLLR